MSLIMRWVLAPAVLVGCLVATASVLAALTAEIRDGADFFTPETVKKADAEIKDIKHNFKKDLLIETYNTVSADKAEEVKKMDRKARNRFFQDWAHNRAKAVEVNGVYVLICKDPGHIQVDVGNDTQKKAFTLNDRDKLRDILLTHFQEAAKGKGEAEKKKLHDRGLIEAVEFVRKTMSENLGKAATSPAGGPANMAHAGSKPAPPVSLEEERSSSMGWVGWLCVGLLVVLVVWAIVGLIRAFTGAGRPGPISYGGAGPAPGYGGGGWGGGGGFMSGLLGGLFGAAAGSWLYDTFAHGGSSHGGGWGSSPAYGAGTGPVTGSAPSVPTEDTDYSGTGGDFGDDAGVGDDAAGGGDFDGGGGDFGGGDFGGGDFGGGGGDFGGGGGDF